MIEAVLDQMKNDNKSDYTINFTRKALTFLARKTTLSEPETVKAVIADLQSRDGYKRNLCIAYNKYCQQHKIEWKMPIYREEEASIKLPTKERIDLLIANASTVLSLKLSMSKETGIRPVELMRLLVKDVDTEQKKIYPTTAKRGQSRTLRISQNLAERIGNWVKTKRLQREDKLFKGDADHYGDDFRMMRNKLAEKLKDPKIHEIRLYDIRHYFCTHTLHNTDIYFTMVAMGHRKLTTTQKYLHLIEQEADDEFIVKAAANAKEAITLIETGFQYVTTIEGVQLFKRRK